MDKYWAEDHHIRLTRLPKPMPIAGFHGEVLDENTVTHCAVARMRIHDHVEAEAFFYVTVLSRYPIILGMPWLTVHNPLVNWTSRTISFQSQFCHANCNTPARPATVKCLQDVPPKARPRETPLRKPDSNEEPEPQPESESRAHDSGAATRPPPEVESKPSRERSRLDIQRVSLHACAAFARRGEEVSAITLDQVNHELRRRDVTAAVLDDLLRRDPTLSRASTRQAMGLSVQSSAETDLTASLPPELKDFADVFNPQEAAKLPPHRDFDHEIKLIPGKEPPFGPLYPMSRPHLMELKAWIEENLAKGFIRPSSSPAASPVLFVKKDGGKSLRLCMDYRGLNAVSVKDRYPLPLTKETLNNLKGMMYFSKIDIISAFNNIRMKAGTEYLTAFRTKLGLFESLVMPFGLTGAPATFQRYINTVLRQHIDICCNPFIDDILVYSRNRSDHVRDVRNILTCLREAGLYAKASKCSFFENEVTFLGLIVGRNGIRMDPEKIRTIVEWQAPRTVTDVKAFTGFAGFYRRFIKDFSRILAPITALEKKTVPFCWTAECQERFDRLKTAFTTEPILRAFDWNRPAVLETDSSDFVSSGVLSQHDDEGILHPVAFFSKKLTPTECNYEIYDKELMAIVRCLEEWKPELEGSESPVSVLTDHRNLEYFMSTKHLNRRQMRWSEFLTRFNLNITYRPGKQGVKPDSLTRRSQDLPEEGDERLLHQSRTIIKREMLQDFPQQELDRIASQDQPESSLNSDSDTEVKSQIRTGRHTRRVRFQLPEPEETVSEQPVELPDWLKDLLEKAYEEDPLPSSVLHALDRGDDRHPDITLSLCSRRSGYLFYEGRLYIPDLDDLKAELMKECHENPVAGHPGRTKTYELMRRSYYWPDMSRQVARWVKNCDTCRRTTPSREGQQGVLRQLEAPDRAWKHISMDFITHLPESNGFDAILVVVDRLTKFRHFIPCKGTANAEEVARLFRDNVWRSHGLPETIVSDRGPQFISAFWSHLNKILRTRALLSTAHHPQTDGQTERMNAILEQYLRAYVSYLQDDWTEWLATAELAGNSMTSETTRCSPFFAMYGFEPRMGFEPTTPDNRPAVRDAHAFAENMQKIWEHCRTEMLAAQGRQEHYKNKNRKPARQFREGQLVWVDSRNVTTLRPQKKLDWKNLGPFRITKVVSPWAYRLDLPSSMRIHPVFNVSLLRPAATDPLPGQVNPPPPPVQIRGIDEWEVDEIVDSYWNRRGGGKHLRYIVRWIGYPDPTDEPARNVANAAECVATFHRRYPDKPGPR